MTAEERVKRNFMMYPNYMSETLVREMKEYAEQVAKQVLHKAAEIAAEKQDHLTDNLMRYIINIDTKQFIK